MYNVYPAGYIVFHYTGVYRNDVLQNKEIYKANKLNPLICRPESFGMLRRVYWYCTYVHEFYESKGVELQNT
jgi:hypothetical protein